MRRTIRRGTALSLIKSDHMTLVLMSGLPLLPPWVRAAFEVGLFLPSVPCSDGLLLPSSRADPSLLPPSPLSAARLSPG